MNALKKQEVVDTLKQGRVIYMNGSNMSEKRLYKLNTTKNEIEYSDNNISWKKSNLKLKDFEHNEWIVYRK